MTRIPFTSPEEAICLASSKDGPDLILIRGLPGAGKSTFASDFVPHSYFHIETDMYFYVDGEYRFKPDLINDAHDWCLSSVKALRNASRKIVVSNIFQKLRHLTPYLNLSENAIVIQMDSIHRSTHRISESTMTKMRKGWENF